MSDKLTQSDPIHQIIGGDNNEWLVLPPSLLQDWQRSGPINRSPAGRAFPPALPLALSLNDHVVEQVAWRTDDRAGASLHLRLSLFLYYYLRIWALNRSWLLVKLRILFIDLTCQIL